MSTPRRVQSVNPQKTSSSGVSIESLSSARSVPAVRNDCARSTASYDDDLDDDLDHDYDNGSLRSRESAIAPPVRPRRVNSTGVSKPVFGIKVKARFSAIMSDRA